VISSTVRSGDRLAGDSSRYPEIGEHKPAALIYFKPNAIKLMSVVMRLMRSFFLACMSAFGRNETSFMPQGV
jgi:hypothetical protein